MNCCRLHGFIGKKVVSKKQGRYTVESRLLKETIRNFWNKSSPNYDTYFGHGLNYCEEKQAWLALLKEVVGTAPVKILDAGAGTGFLALLLAELGHEVTAVDLAEGMLNEGKKKAAALHLPVDWRLGDIEALEFQANTFDVVISRHVFWTLTDHRTALLEWKRVLREGGKVIIMDARWGNNGIMQGVRRNIRNLVKVLRGKEEWLKKYEQVRPLLACYGGVHPDLVAGQVTAAGFDQAVALWLHDIYHTEKRVMSWYFRLTANCCLRYMVTGQKAGPAVTASRRLSSPLL